MILCLQKESKSLKSLKKLWVDHLLLVSPENLMILKTETCHQTFDKQKDVRLIVFNYSQIFIDYTIFKSNSTAVFASELYFNPLDNAVDLFELQLTYQNFMSQMSLLMSGYPYCCFTPFPSLILGIQPKDTTIELHCQPFFIQRQGLSSRQNLTNLPSLASNLQSSLSLLNHWDLWACTTIPGIFP